MKKLIKVNIWAFPIMIIAILLMSFNTIPDKDNKQEANIDLVPSELPPASGLYVSQSTVEVNFNLSGHYVVRYSDNVSGLAPNHTISWGCGSIDVDPDASGWQCTRSETYFYAATGTDCNYIAVSSNVTPTPGTPVTHTIDFRVRDDQGEESNWGAITLVINYVENPSNSEPANPCSSY